MEYDTVLTADSVEWCPTPGLQHLLACGTYQLNEQEQLRHGSLLLFDWDGEKLTRVLENETKKYSSGALDMKWKSSDEKGILAIATSGGTVQYFQLQKKENELIFSGLGAVDLCEENEQADKLCLALSVDWSRVDNRVAVSDSLGQVALVELSQSGPRLLQQWKAHGYEAWIVCWGQDGNMVYTGGDDCRLCVWDLRSGTSRACYTSKWHKMGVCSLQVHPSVDHQHILASGSYDESLALWDVRKMTTPLKDKPLGGGVWRIKWHPAHPSLAATACMHNHFNVLDTHLESARHVEVVKCYEGHESLAYGVDWCREGVNGDSGRGGRGMSGCEDGETSGREDRGMRGREDGGISGRGEVGCKRVFTLASCSFYDHSMHLWTVSV